MSKDWQAKIRKDYKGILSDEQIEVTISYWENILKQAVGEAVSQHVASSLGYVKTMIEDDEFYTCCSACSRNETRHRKIIGYIEKQLAQYKSLQ